ncbi:lytic transglycosylase domain-containing protein [Kitasatospora sp. NA04385]|uniref:aggregation-promoting factor C-terminal-like domain-containing protein n=1 Tax=Kitasatospora sp. NA04385 TaxID=2742135 RepID=UPI001591C7F1|nr:lytic transglycosylase domain-containing protein [Kitasatospora sp. NA04385]QKW23741.1 lytic transglycosylase domain-containing protein [Kitasatospora sp. NA04385]
MHHRRTLTLSEKLRRHRNVLVTGIATFAVAGTATLALAMPQGADSADAAANPTLADRPQLSADAFASQSAAASRSAASASASQQAQAEADAAEAASASASAEAEAAASAAAQAAAEASASASASAQAEADAKAEAAAQAKAKAEAAAEASAEAKARASASASASAASRSQQRSPLSATASPSATGSGSSSASSSASSTSAYSGTPQQIAAQIVPAGQLQCFSNIVERESSWNVHATNASSGAYGLMQALPGSKMASVGADWRDNPVTQIKWGLQYMNETYGSPCAAWSFWQSHNWY